MTGQRTVLVVEDNPITQKMMVVTLRAAGYRVLAASEGRQALEYFERESPDLVLQDLVLPDMDGIEFARQIRARPTGRETALVALSGLASMLEMAQSSAHGFASCLFKPVEPSRLVAHLAEILRPDGTASQGDTPRRRVLLVDDDPALLKLARLRLEECGFAVSGVNDGEQALAAARGDIPDAIVTDLLMPGLDGLDLCRKVREDAVLGQVPIIIMSASAPPEHVDDLKLARTAGANAFVERTPSFDTVVRALDQCLSTTDHQPVTPAPDLTRLRNEFNGRLVQHLDRQASINQILAREAASKTSPTSWREAGASTRC
jgi:two-component system, cell cycle response regulator